MWENEELFEDDCFDLVEVWTSLLLRNVFSCEWRHKNPSSKMLKRWTEAINFLSKSNCSKLIHWSRYPFAQSWIWIRCVFQMHMHAERLRRLFFSFKFLENYGENMKQKPLLYSLVLLNAESFMIFYYVLTLNMVFNRIKCSDIALKWVNRNVSFLWFGLAKCINFHTI